MKMYKICLHGVDIICEKVCKTKKDAELEFINLVYENYNEIQFEDYKEESYIEEIEVCTEPVYRRFPNIMLFRIWTDSEESNFEEFCDEISDSIETHYLDEKILKNTNIIKIELFAKKYKNDNRLLNNTIYITFGINTTKCKTLDDILDEACGKCYNILNKYEIAKFVTMNEEDIIKFKFNNFNTSNGISYDGKEIIIKVYKKYCTIK